MATEATRDRRLFSRKARQMVCERVLELPGMELPGRRDYLLRQVASDYPGMRAVRRDDDAHVDLMEIVTAAYDYPGALQAILDTMNYLYPSDTRLKSLKDMINAVDPESLLNRDELRHLLDLLATTPPTVAARALHYSTRTTTHDVGLDPNDLTALVSRLANLPCGVGRPPPLFEFVDYVAHRSPPSLGAALHQWIDEFGERLEGGRSVVDKLCDATDNRLTAKGRFYLIAELRPDRMRDGRFFVAAWRQHEDEPEETFFQSDRSVRLEEALASTHQLMQQLTVDLEATAEERVLELILPRCLITLSVDQWLVDAVLPSAIGTHYPLVLRSFDRLDDPSMYVDWGRNWRWLKRHDRTAGVEALREVDSHDLAAVQALRAALLRDGPPAIVLMLKALPDGDALGTDAYTAGLRGGAPIMLWSRDDAVTDELIRSVRVACSQSLLNLREHVFQLRLSALQAADRATAGDHTVIIFDDYDRIPERFRSRARLRSPRPAEAAS